MNISALVLLGDDVIPALRAVSVTANALSTVVAEGGQHVASSG
jgi:hypothetical protein